MSRISKMIVFFIVIFLLSAIYYIAYTDNNFKALKKENTVLNEQLMKTDALIHELETQVMSEEDEEIIEKLKEENTVLNEQLIKKDASISELQTHVKFTEDEKAIEELKEVNISLNKELEVCKELIEEYKDTSGEQNIIIERLKFELSSNLIYDNILIDLKLTEDRAIDLFGKPITENIEIMGSDGIWYLEGRYSKESIYNNFTLHYYGDRDGENFELVSISTESSDLYLTEEIRVGDSKEDLLSRYPMLIEDTWSNKGERYLYQDRFDMRGVFFEIKDKKISKIIISRFFD